MAKRKNMQSVAVCHEKDIHSRKLTGCRRMLKPSLGEPRFLLIALAWLKLRCSFAALISNRPWRWLCAAFTNEEHLTFPFFPTTKAQHSGEFSRSFSQTEEADGQRWHSGQSVPCRTGPSQH